MGNVSCRLYKWLQARSVALTATQENDAEKQESSLRRSLRWGGESVGNRAHVGQDLNRNIAQWVIR